MTAEISTFLLALIRDGGFQVETYNTTCRLLIQEGYLLEAPDIPRAA